MHAKLQPRGDSTVSRHACTARRWSDTRAWGLLSFFLKTKMKAKFAKMIALPREAPSAVGCSMQSIAMHFLGLLVTTRSLSVQVEILQTHPSLFARETYNPNHLITHDSFLATLKGVPRCYWIEIYKQSHRAQFLGLHVLSL